MPDLLPYESRPEKNRRTPWVYAVVGIYLLFFVFLLTLPALAAIDTRGAALMDDYGPVYMFCKTALAVGLLLVLGTSLLVVPVRAGRGRVITRRAIWIPLIGSSVLFAILLAGGAMATIEYLKAEGSVLGLVAAIGVPWLCWLIVFGLMGRSVDPRAISSRLYKTVVAGSLLELLVAVPLHILVRRRNECCAGIMTGMAICVGAVVALVAMGPAVLMLYRRRWNDVYRRRDTVVEPTQMESPQDSSKFEG